VCFVCLGNICRSPTAEGIFLRLVAEAGLADRIRADSAGTAAYHVGERPDRRSRAEARRRGTELPGRARAFEPGDFERFDYVLAMDAENHAVLRELAPAGHAARVELLRRYDPAAPPGADVPDPYYGGENGFAEVYDLCEAACRGLLERIRDEHLR